MGVGIWGEGQGGMGAGFRIRDRRELRGALLGVSSNSSTMTGDSPGGVGGADGDLREGRDGREKNSRGYRGRMKRQHKLNVKPRLQIWILAPWERERGRQICLLGRGWNCHVAKGVQ